MNMLGSIGTLFTFLFINPITNALLACYKFLLYLHVPSPLGFAIILLTIIVRAILYPFMASQIKHTYRMQAVAPHLAALKEKHKDNKQKQNEEMMKLYKEHGINPAAGCLPMLIQLPITIALYEVLSRSITVSAKIPLPALIQKINDVMYFPFLRINIHTWNTTFFGLPMDKAPNALFAHMPLIILFPLLSAAFQFVLSKMMVPPKQPGAEVAKKASADDFTSAMQTQSLFLFPAMIGFFAWILPSGLSLYWITLTVFGIIQQYILVGPGGLEPWLAKIKK